MTELVVLAPTWRVHSAIFLFTPSRFRTGHPFHQMLERQVTQQRKKNTTSALWQARILVLPPPRYTLDGDILLPSQHTYHLP